MRVEPDSSRPEFIVMGIPDPMPRFTERPKVDDIQIVFILNKEGKPEMTCLARRGHMVSIYANCILVQDWDLQE